MRPDPGRPSERRGLLAAVALPPEGHVGVLARMRLTIELVAAYAVLIGAVRSDDLVAMATAARAPGRGRVATPPTLEHATAVRLGRIVGRVFDVLPMDSRCLVRSLVLLRVLGRRSIHATLQIGVKAEGDFGAHAWVEHDGAPVLRTGHVARLVEL